MVHTLYTIGYEAWPVQQRFDRIMQVLQQHEVALLVDIRSAPWALPPEESEMQERCVLAGMTYLWMVELGNPQPEDPNLTVLEAHLAAGDPVPSAYQDLLWSDEVGLLVPGISADAVLHDLLAAEWPVNRGLLLLRQLVLAQGDPCCLLCACPEYGRCHRRLIAETLRDRYFFHPEGMMDVRDLTP